MEWWVLVLITFVLVWPYAKYLYTISHKSRIPVPYVKHDIKTVKDKWNASLYDLKNRKCLVTGASGRLGSVIIKQLCARGVTQIVAVDCVPPRKTNPNVQFVKADICDYNSIKKVFEETKPHTVFHTAASIDVKASYDTLYKVNVGGTKNVVKCSQEGGVLQLIHTSTATVIQSMNGNFFDDESTPYLTYYGKFNYAATKAMAEREVLSNNGVNGVMTIALRFDNMVSSRAPLVAIVAGASAVLFGSGSNKQSFIFLPNVAHAHVLAAEKMLPEASVSGKAYHVNDERDLEYREFFNTLREKLNLKPPVMLPWMLGYLIFVITDFINLITYPFLSYDLNHDSYFLWRISTEYTYNGKRFESDFGYKPTSMEAGWVKLVKQLQKMKKAK